MRSRLLWLSSMALALVACSGAGSSSPSNDGGVPSSNDRDATADARARDATSDASRESAVACASDPAPPNIDSTARIHFVLTNTSPSPRYVLSGAARCEAFSIDGVRMSVPFSCGCECPPPADQMHFTPIAPGASITLDWNAYRIVLYESRESCSDWGRPDVCASYTFGAYQAVAAGDYEARFMVAESALVPDAGSSVCSGSPDLGYECHLDGSYSGGGDGPCDPSVVGVTTQMTSVTFSMPQSGDVNVAVAIP